jgi:hypothetical protein
MRLPHLLVSGALALATIGSAACGGHHGGNGDDAGGDDDSGDACVGLECFQVDCPSGGTTSVSGTVYAPNGTLPLYNVTVYVPNGTPSAFPEGATCDQCGTVLSGNPLVQTTTDTEGHFTLPDMPATDAVPLVVQVGKWRRQIVIPSVPQCTDSPLAEDDTRLPRNQGEGDIPLMALTTGSADALECLLRKIGIDDSEFTTAGGSGRVHLFAGAGGTDQYDSSTGGGATFAPATDLWGSAAITPDLTTYDVVLLSCEGGQNPDQKDATALTAMKDYADIGGRVFMSHWHNYWIEAGPAPWPSTVTRENLADLGNVTADVNRGFDRGEALAQWLLNVQASTVLGKIDVIDTQHTITGVNDALVDTWIHLDDNANGQPSIQYMSFTTPLEADEEDRCGRVVFSDIHVSSGDDSNTSLAFPSGGCTTDVDVLSPQEKVLAFMLFDIASCIGPVVD